MAKIYLIKGKTMSNDLVTKLVTEIKNAIDAQKYHLRRNMRENLKKKAEDRNVSDNGASYRE